MKGFYMKKTKGFTLAEVLLTLGIIGVVAIITLPTLSMSIQGAQHKAKFQKVVNSLSNAVAMNVSLENYDFSQTESDSNVPGQLSLYNIFTNRLTVMKVDNTTYPVSNSSYINTFGGSGNYTLYFKDGSSLTFPKQGGDGVSRLCLEDSPCKGVVDINGLSGPNRMVSCDDGGNYNNCKVTKAADVYPVLFYDSTVAPNSNAARSALYKKK